MVASELPEAMRDALTLSTAAQPAERRAGRRQLERWCSERDDNLALCATLMFARSWLLEMEHSQAALRPNSAARTHALACGTASPALTAWLAVNLPHALQHA